MLNRYQRRLNAYLGKSRKNVLFQLGKGETKTVNALILYFDGGLFRDEADEDGWIRETRKQVSVNADIPYASLKRGVDRLIEKGVLEWSTTRGWRFDYSRWLKMSQPVLIRESTPKGDEIHPSASVPVELAVPVPSGGDELRQKELGEEEVGNESAPIPLLSQAVGMLVKAGADRAGAVKAVKAARQSGTLRLEAVEAVVKAVAALSTRPYRPGGLLCAAVARPELGRKLIRDTKSELAAHNRLVVGSIPTGSTTRPEASVLPLNYARTVLRPESFVDGDAFLDALMRGL